MKRDCIYVFLILLSVLWQFSVSNEAVISNALKEYSEVPIECMWRLHDVNPSYEHPFIFFHQRKCGGTTLRETLGSAVKAMSIHSCIVSHSSCGYSIFSVPWNYRYSLYAGHFNWQSSMKNMPAMENDLTSTIDVPNCPSSTFTCLTNFREPVARVESCIYERFERVFKYLEVKCINDIPIEDFTEILITFRHKKGNNQFGCLNEQFRIFGTADEDVLANLGFDYDSSTKQVTTKVTQLEADQVNNVMENIKQCVPLVLELPDSKRVLQKVFPHLYYNGAFNESVIKSVGKNGHGCAPLDAPHREVLTKLTSLEKIVYDTVVAKVQAAIKKFGPKL